MGNQLRIATPKTNEQTHYVTEYYFDSVTYSFIRTRENVKEIVEWLTKEKKIIIIRNNIVM